MDILLVDDNEDDHALMKEVLTANGYHVHTALDGLEGCDILATADIDLIISDIRMPRLDGLKLHAFAREIERYRKTKFIFVSGFKDLYADAVNMDPEFDFMIDETTPIKDLVRMVDRLMYGQLDGAWI